MVIVSIPDWTGSLHSAPKLIEVLHASDVTSVAPNDTKMLSDATCVWIAFGWSVEGSKIIVDKIHLLLEFHQDCDRFS
jgi:hypothetical protein